MKKERYDRKGKKLTKKRDKEEIRKKKENESERERERERERGRERERENIASWEIISREKTNPKRGCGKYTEEEKDKNEE